MTTYGVTTDGFVKKTLSEIIDSLQNKAEEIFGQDVDLTESSPIELFLEACAVEAADIWDQLEDVYYSGFVDTAEGASLDYLGTLVGSTRQTADYASGIVRFVGVSGVVVPQLTRISTAGGTQFQTIYVATIPSGLVRDTSISAIESGAAGNVEALAIDRFVTSIDGVTDLYNPSATLGGADLETDAEFRDRIKNALSRASVATMSGIVASLADLEDVNSVHGIEDLVVHTATFYVDGGDALEITNTLAEVRPAGIECFWYRPTNISIYVSAVVTQDGSISDSTIIETIADYINGLDVEEDVKFSRLLHTLMEIDGMTDVDLSIGTTSPPTSKSNISIGNNQVAYTQTSFISIT